MSRLRLAQKLQPAKRAWKSFSNTLQSEVHKLNIPKAIKTTIQRLLSTLHSLPFTSPSKAPRSLTRPSYSPSYNQVHRKNFDSICIDQVFAEHSSNNSRAQGETSIGKEVIEDRSGVDTIEDVWKAVVAKSPHLRVDERVEEFILKFREDLKIQKQISKERSLLKFQERLARGA